MEKEAGDRTFQATQAAVMQARPPNRRIAARATQVNAVQGKGGLYGGPASSLSARALAQSARGSPSHPCPPASLAPRSSRSCCVGARSPSSGGSA